VDTERMTAHIRSTPGDPAFYGPYSWLIREKQAEWGDVPAAEVCLSRAWCRASSA
jgi:hypothetical protein